MVRQFIQAYNRFDMDGMLRDADEAVRFTNKVRGETTLTTNGKAALRNQAEEAAGYFIQREQKILHLREKGNRVIVDIEFSGILKKDMPGGPGAGEALRLTCQSVYSFENDKITEILDISRNWFGKKNNGDDHESGAKA